MRAEHAVAAGGVAAALLLLGCGGATTTEPRGPVVVASGDFVLTDATTANRTGRPCDLFGLRPFSVSSAGTLRVTVVWFDPDFDVDVSLLRGTCACEQALRADCDVVVLADESGLSESLSRQVRAGGRFTLAALIRFGTGTTTASYEVVLEP